MRPETEGLRIALRQRHADADPEAICVVRAPGRVNLIGEHTDYNDGLVLPMAIDLEIVIAYVPTNERRVEITLLDGGETDGFDLDVERPPSGGWLDYIAGMAWSLARNGVAMRGLRGVLGSTLPMSSGLASSAALELASGLALVADPGAIADRVALARIAQRAENEYVGVNSGLMDQLASALGREDGALLIDCRTLAWQPVSLPLEAIAVVAIDSGSPRRLGASEYNARRRECNAAVAALGAVDPAVRSLRDATMELLERAGDRIDRVSRRRAEHVVRENGRVLDCVAAFERGDLAAVGGLLAESHVSLRDLYDVSSPELDTLVEIATSVDGVLGARMTGAGFGGCTVNLVRRDAVPELAAAVARQYPRRRGLEARVLPVEPAAGAGPA